jgi:2-hydroxy-3-oxopropionate reductase
MAPRPTRWLPRGRPSPTAPPRPVRGATHVITMLTDGNVVERVLFETGVAEALDPAPCRDRHELDPARPGARPRRHGLKARPVPPRCAGQRRHRGRRERNACDHGRRRSGRIRLRCRACSPRWAAPSRVGPSGAGQLAKLANQAIVGIAIGAVAEATLLVSEGGGDLDAFRAALAGGFADSTILQLHGATDAGNDFRTRAAGSRFSSRTWTMFFGSCVILASNCRWSSGPRSFRPAGRRSRRRDLDHSALFLELLELNGTSVDICFTPG